MKVLALATQKGGAGKTTIAASIAVAAAEAGERVIAVDLDPQGSLLEWGGRRGEDENLLVEAFQPAGLAHALDKVRKAGAASLVVLDTPGIMAPAVAVALDPADFVLVPVRPTIKDIKATGPVAKLLRSKGKRYGFVLSQVNAASTARNLDAAAALMADSAQTPPMVGARNDFIDSDAAGRGVTEWAPRGKSAAEIRYLWRYVRAQLDGGNHV